MPNIVCDKCEARFDVGDDAAGTTVYCPKCGAANGVPAGATAGPAGRPATGSAVAPERTLLRLRPAMFRARPALFTLLMLIFLGGVVGGIYFQSQSQQARAIACGIAAIAGLVLLAVWRVAKLGTAMEVTTRRTIVYRGLLSKSSSEVMHTEISNFQIKQSFLNRIFHVGSIGISSSAQEGIEILVTDIPGPYRVRELIDANRNMGRPA
jgi:hypothetical protein